MWLAATRICRGRPIVDAIVQPSKQRELPICWDSSFTCRFVESRVDDRYAQGQNCGVGSADQPVRRRHRGWRTTPKALQDGKTAVAAIATP
jgi:hypothetical protein